MTGDPVPSIPQWLERLPTSGGLVVPWITPSTADGRHLFGALHPARLLRALRQRLCGVCGRALEHPMVLLMRESDLALHGTVEPAVHPPCAAYSSHACPMLAGRMGHYRSTLPCLDSTMIHSHDASARLGADAEPWFSVWLHDYQLTRIHGHLAASYTGITPLRIRAIRLGAPGS